MQNDKDKKGNSTIKGASDRYERYSGPNQAVHDRFRAEKQRIEQQKRESHKPTNTEQLADSRSNSAGSSKGK